MRVISFHTIGEMGPACIRRPGEIALVNGNSIISALNLGKSRSVYVNEPECSGLLVHRPVRQAKLGGSRQIRDKACASPPRKAAFDHKFGTADKRLLGWRDSSNFLDVPIHEH